MGTVGLRMECGIATAESPQYRRACVGPVKQASAPADTAPVMTIPVLGDAFPHPF